jgi:cytochrome c biogenesis protein CcmG/thiol:disulfide interchange protein DsbE
MDDIVHISPPTLPSSRRLRRRRVGALALACALVVAGCSGGSGSEGAGGEPSDGERLPAVRLTDLTTGDEVGWPEGTPLVVNLWASWCAPCRKEMPAFDAVAAQLGDQVAIVGVTDDLQRDAAVDTARETGVSYPLRYDEEAALLTQLGISGLPATVFVDEDGTIVGRHLGALTEDELLAEIEDNHGIAP